MGEETLLIVGNGFDLSMGFKTSYGDFMKSSFFPKFDSTLCSYLRKQFQENMGWIDIENELSEFSNVISSMKQDAKKKHTKWEYDNFRKEYDDLKLSLKSIFKKKPKDNLF